MSFVARIHFHRDLIPLLPHRKRTGDLLYSFHDSPSVKDVTDRPTGTRTVSHSLAGFLIPLATILIFADIALFYVGYQVASG